MSVSVVVPWRPDGAERQAVWGWLRTQWAQAHPEWEVVLGTPPPGAWNKAAAIVDGIRAARGDLLVIADADVWCDNVSVAVGKVASGENAWAIPHGPLHRLTDEATQQVIHQGVAFADLPASAVGERYRGHPGGGIAVLPRELYRAVPMDDRMGGPGPHDSAWAFALTTIGGVPYRPVGQKAAVLWHLWHEPARRNIAAWPENTPPEYPRAWGTPAYRELWRRYERAAGNRETMAALLEGIEVRP